MTRHSGLTAAAVFLLGPLFLPQNVCAQMSETGQLIAISSVTATSMTLTSSAASDFAATSSSGIHVLQGRVKLNPGAYIEWPDGSISTSANSSPIFNSTWTHFNSYHAFNNPPDQFLYSVPGTTLTLSMSGRRALLAFSCPFQTQSSLMGAGFLINGDFVDGQTIASNGSLLSNMTTYDSGLTLLMGGFVHLTEGTFNGSVSFSVAITSVFTGGVAWGATLNQDENVSCQFSVTER